MRKEKAMKRILANTIVIVFGHQNTLCAIFFIADLALAADQDKGDWVECYWCKKYFYNITSAHFVMHNGQYTCPEHVGDSERHLQTYVLTKCEEAVDRAFEKRDQWTNPQKTARIDNRLRK
jgi:hypothetical protein